jgi:hypothetical protein
MRKLIVIAALLVTGFAYGQTPTDTLPGDPGGLYIYTIQNMSFGAFSHGNSGGTVSVTPAGIRSSTGDVLLLNLGFQYYNAIFELEAPPGAIISVINGPDVVLTGSNGGSMTLHIGSHDPPTPFGTVVQPPGRTEIRFGGTLTIGNAATSPPGTYSGSFYIMFNQE